MASLTWRNRAVTVSCVCVFLAISRMLVPDPWLRAERQYLFVITLGYGHLIGAAVFARQRMERFVPARFSRRLLAAAAVLAVLDLFVLYAWASNVSLAFFLPLLAVSIWHVVENDLTLPRAYARGLAMEPLPRSRDHHLAAIAATSLLLALGQQLLGPVSSGTLLGGAALAEIGSALLRSVAVAAGLWLGVRRRGRLRVLGLGIAASSVALSADASLLASFSFGDFFSALTLYHLVQFLVLFADRIRRIADPLARRHLIRRLAWVHVTPICVCAVLLLVPGDRLAALRYALFSPAIYLFWSVLHVGQTIAARGLEHQTVAVPRTLLV